MKTLGLIGGISWVSTTEYYRHINEGINLKLGGLNFAQCIIHSFNYADIVHNNETNNWKSTLNMITNASLNLKQSGADAILLCANTMHKIADELEQNIQLPVINIATETAREIECKGLKTVGLLGTKFTMELDFFKDKLTQHGIKTLIPGDEDRAFIHHTIADELGKGIFKPETKERYLSIIDQLIAAGAEGVILGCTEIPLLISNHDTPGTLFDTMLIHSKAAVKFALGN